MSYSRKRQKARWIASNGIILSTGMVFAIVNKYSLNKDKFGIRKI